MRRLEASANHSSEKERTFPPNAADIKSEHKSIQFLHNIPRHVWILGEGWGLEWFRTRSGSTVKHNVSAVVFHRKHKYKCLKVPALSEK